jgi:hypothetical protein
MNQVLKALALSSMAALMVSATPACNHEESKGPEATGYLRAAITVGGSHHDVTAIQYVVVDAGGACSDAPIAQSTSPLEVEAIPGSVLPAGSGTHAGADGFFVLPPGNYRVCATPLGLNGPSQECAPTQGPAAVIPGATNEIVLVSQCQGDPGGGVDTVVALNDPPQITDLTIAPSKFILACETATMVATAEDPDGDAFDFAWSITASPFGASPQLQGTNGVASFATDVPGDYEVKITVTDVHSGTSSLTFPIHVSPLVCVAQDQCHVAGSCDMSTLACSNPLAPDGWSCDDGDASTTSDVCSVGVCSGSGGATCGDGVCAATESCQSCEADCGVCATCASTDLGSTVPQMVTGTTVGLPNLLTPSCSYSYAPEATFAFTAPADGTYTFSTAGSPFDTILYIDAPSCLGASLACNDDYIGLQSWLQVTLTAGQAIVVVVDGFAGGSGPFTLTIQ